MNREGRVAAKAAAIIAEVERELALGTKYFDGRGNRLETVVAVLKCVEREGSVVVEPVPERRAEYRKAAQK